MRASAMLACVAVLLVGCSDDDEAAREPSTEATGASSTSTTADPARTTSTSSPTTERDCSNRAAGSSAAAFDPAAGTYAAQDASLDVDALTFTFNVVQWLAGEDARRAWEDDHPEDPDGPPNDYYIVDESDRLRTAPISADTEVFLTHLRDDGTAAVERDTIDGLDGYLDEGDPGDTYWLTFESGGITHICEQYRP